MREFLAVANALSDANRVRLLLGLCHGELCVCSLVNLVGLADSTVSKHMSILKQAGLVEARKQGRWVYYRLAGLDASALVRQIVALAEEHLREDRVIAQDAARIAALHQLEAGASCVAGRFGYLAPPTVEAAETA